QCFSNRLTDHLCRRQRRHAPVIRVVHPAGQAVRTVWGGEEVLPIDPDGRGSWEAQRLGLLLRGYFDKADRFSDLSLSQRLTEPLQREIVRRAIPPNTRAQYASQSVWKYAISAIVIPAWPSPHPSAGPAGARTRWAALTGG